MHSEIEKQERDTILRWLGEQETFFPEYRPVWEEDGYRELYRDDYGIVYDLQYRDGRTGCDCVLRVTGFRDYLFSFKMSRLEEEMEKRKEWTALHPGEAVAVRETASLPYKDGERMICFQLTERQQPVLRWNGDTPWLTVDRLRHFDEDEFLRFAIDIGRAALDWPESIYSHNELCLENTFYDRVHHRYLIGNFGDAHESDWEKEKKFREIEDRADEFLGLYGGGGEHYYFAVMLYQLLNDLKLPGLEEGWIDLSQPPAHGGKRLQEIVLKACQYTRSSRPTIGEVLIELKSWKEERERLKEKRTDTFGRAQLLYRQQDYENAALLWSLYAEAGDAEAQGLMGWLYANGLGVEENAASAFRWYQKAAAQSDMDAAFNLGVLYETGRGVERDYSLAVNWYSAAAALGDSQAEARARVLSTI
ncbi:MAG: sel1 repeat family protein [Lachnospiraceae bacterium]|nr:sel1 repeat family protein [Lachnospiraceae bacterium]